MDASADFRRIKCTCGKRIRVANQINVVSMQCPRCGRQLTSLGTVPRNTARLSRVTFAAFLATMALSAVAIVLIAVGCVERDKRERAEARAKAAVVTATDWLLRGIKANPEVGERVERQLNEALLDAYLLDKSATQDSLDDIRQRISEVTEYARTRQLLIKARGMLLDESLEHATLLEIRQLIDAYLEADAETSDPAEAKEARDILAAIDVSTDRGRIQAVLESLDDTAFHNAERSPPMDGLASLHPSLKNYHRKWVFPEVYKAVSETRGELRRKKEEAEKNKQEEEKRQKFAVRADFVGEVLGEDPFIFQVGEWTYMLTGGRRISILRSTDLMKWEDRGELLDDTKTAAAFPGSLLKPECFATNDGIAVRCVATRPGGQAGQIVFTAYVKTLDPKEIAPNENVFRVEEGQRDSLDRALTLDGKRWHFGVKATEYRGYAEGYSFANRAIRGHSLTCIYVTCNGKSRVNLYKSLEGNGVQELGTLVLAEYLKYSDIGGVHPFLDSSGRPFLAHHFSNTERGGRKTICIRPIVFAADGWPLAGEPLSDSRGWQNDGAALQTGTWTHICTPNIVPGSLTRLEATGALSEQSFQPDGTIGGKRTGFTWRQKGDSLTLEFPRPASDERMPDANYVDECVLGGKGTWYVGRNQFGELIRGLYQIRFR